MREDRFAQAVVGLVRLKDLVEREAEWEAKFPCPTPGFYLAILESRNQELAERRAELRSAFEQMLEL